MPIGPAFGRPGAGGAVDSVFGRTGVVVAQNDDYNAVAFFEAQSAHLSSDVTVGSSIGQLRFSGVSDRTLDYNATEDALAVSTLTFLLNSRDVVASTSIGFGAQAGSPPQRPNLTFVQPQDRFHFNRQCRIYPPGTTPGPDPQDYSGAAMVAFGGPVIMAGVDLRGEDVYVNFYNTSGSSQSIIYFHNGLAVPNDDPEANHFSYNPEDAPEFPFQLTHSLLVGGNGGDIHAGGRLVTRGTQPGTSPSVGFGIGPEWLLSRDSSNNRFDFDHDLNVQGSTRQEHADFVPQVSAPSREEGRVWYDPDLQALTLYPGGTEVVHQLGHELLGRVLNNSGATITNGSVVKVMSNVGGVPTIELADASDGDPTAAVATEDIADGSVGLVTAMGAVNEVNTAAFPVGTLLYLSETPGEFTDQVPSSPLHQVLVGQVINSHATLGAIYVRITPRGNEQDVEKFFNGVFIENTTTVCSSDGSNISLTLDNPVGDKLTLVFEGGLEQIDVPAPVILTAGTDTVPVLNYVFIPQSTMTLTANTTGFPAEEHAPIATVLAQSAASAQADGVYKHHQWNDHLSDSNDQGHLSHLNAWIRSQHATWRTGGTPTVTRVEASEPDDLYFAMTAGTALQLHVNSFTALDMQAGDHVYIVNDPATAYRKATNLNTITEDANGDDLDGKYFSLVFLCVVNSDGTSQVLCNLPNGWYDSTEEAIDDANGFSNYSLPEDFRGTGILIARATIYYTTSNDGTFELQQLDDLRGNLIGVVSGGGGGGGGAGAEFGDASFRVFNSTDATKELALDVSGVTAGNTRSLAVPDKDGTFALTSDVDPKLGPANVYTIDGQGQYTEYAASADTNAARGIALASAIAAATAGTTVHVRPGVYDANLLMKDGITLDFEPGAVVNYTGATSGALFDDGNTSMSMVVSGEGVFTHNGTGADRQGVNLENGSSALFMRCKSLEAVNGVAIRVAGVGSGGVRVYADEVTSSDGTLDNLSTGMFIEVFSRVCRSTDNFVIESDGGSITVHGALLDAESTYPLEYVSGDLVRLVDCTLKAFPGEPCASGGPAVDSVVLIRCELDSDQATPLQLSNVSLKDCWRKDSTAPITSTGSIKHLDAEEQLNTVHRSSDGSDHTFIDQDVTSGSSPTLDATNITGGRVGFAAIDANQVVTNNSWTRITFTTEQEDTDNAWDNSRFTVPAGKGGMYLFTGLCTVQNLNDGSKMVVAIRINGVLAFLLSRGTVGATDIAGFGGAARYLLNAGDYAEMYVFHDHGSDRSTFPSSGYCHLSAYLESV